MPSTVLSAFSSSIWRKSSAGVIVTEGRMIRLMTPISAAVFSFFLT
jgi:hypothetical protein